MLLWISNCNIILFEHFFNRKFYMSQHFFGATTPISITTDPELRCIDDRMCLWADSWRLEKFRLVMSDRLDLGFSIPYHFIVAINILHRRLISLNVFWLCLDEVLRLIHHRFKLHQSRLHRCHLVLLPQSIPIIHSHVPSHCEPLIPNSHLPRLTPLHHRQCLDPPLQSKLFSPFAEIGAEGDLARPATPAGMF